LPTYTPQELAQIAAIADGMPVGIFVSSAPGDDFVYANHALYELLGSRPGNAIRIEPKSTTYSIHGRDGTLYTQDRLPFARVLREKANVTLDDLVIHRIDDSRVFLRAFASPLRDARGAVVRVLVALTDITEEIEARSRADLFELRLEHVLSHAPLILFAIDRKGIVTLSEGRGLQALGFRSKELVGRSIYELYANDPEALLRADRVLSGEEFTSLSHLGSAVLETTYTTIRDSAGELQGVIGVSVDVTERVNIQNRLLQAERLASMGTLSATVAHEINNPLTYVLGNLELVLKHLERDHAAFRERAALEPVAPAPPTAQIALWAKQAHEGADRVRRIVRGLQTFSRQDDDQAQPTDVHDALRSALAMSDNAIRHRARLVLRLDDVPPVMANDLRLGQVFVNLLLNATQSIPEGHASTNEIRVATSYDAKENTVVIEIEDTGSGIAAEMQSRIFEPFFTTKPVGIGTGLGLSICYGIVRGFAGDIEVKSTPGQGTTFRVHLPAADRSSQATAAPVPAVPNPLRRGRILIVDDDANVARSFAILLGYEHEVEVSLEALGAARRVLAGERFDIIFCDLMMPEMTGMEFYAAIAEGCPEQAARIVFVTGGALTPSASAFVARMSHALLEKPFDKTALDAILASHLEEGRAP
jgi:PAS domain S-box-containing protein